jgi:hypothetical protein
MIRPGYSSTTSKIWDQVIDLSNFTSLACQSVNGKIKRKRAVAYAVQYHIAAD